MEHGEFGSCPFWWHLLARQKQNPARRTYATGSRLLVLLLFQLGTISRSHFRLTEGLAHGVQ